MQTGTEARLLRGYRYSAFAVVGGVAVFDSLFRRTGAPAAPNVPMTAAVLAVFSAALWTVSEQVRARGSSRWGLALLAAQLPACWMAPPALLLVAFEAPFVLGAIDLARWLGVQAIATVGLLALRPSAPLLGLPAFDALPGPIAAGLRGFCWLVAQALVAAAGVLGAQLLRSRRERARLGADLAATRRRLTATQKRAAHARRFSDDAQTMERQLTELVLRLELLSDSVSAPADVPMRSAREAARRLLLDARQRSGRGSLLPSPPAVELGGAIRVLASAVEGARVHLSCPPVVGIPPDAALAAFLFVQDALSSALRRTGARNVWIDLRVTATELRLEMRDDGRGGGAARDVAALERMRDRLRQARGTLAVEKSAIVGWTMTAVLPLASPAEPSARGDVQEAGLGGEAAAEA
jgi:hypothetical protein